MATNTDNPIANIFQFYFDLADKITPVIKQGIEDWFTIYSKLWTEGIRLQGEWLKQFTVDNNTSNFTDPAKEFGEKVTETQKNVTTNIVDAAMENVKTFKEASDKFQSSIKI